MSILPEEIRRGVETALNVIVLAADQLGGGMVSHAARVQTSAGPVAVKWRIDSPAGFFAAEADGLARLRATRTLRVPDVLAVGENPAFVVLEWLAEHPTHEEGLFAQRFGAGLAALHRHTAETFGLERDNFLGSQPQPNMPHLHWPDFYRNCRLLPQIAIARQNNLMPPEREHRLMRVVENLEPLLADLPSQPALIHGDLWSGNFLTLGDWPALIDPAVYFGEREMELAYMELFGGFPQGVFDTYSEDFPLEPGYTHRRALHQLHPLLVHLNHFGERYGASVEEVCRLYRF